MIITCTTLELIFIAVRLFSSTKQMAEDLDKLARNSLDIELDEEKQIVTWVIRNHNSHQNSKELWDQPKWRPQSQAFWSTDFCKDFKVFWEPPFFIIYNSLHSLSLFHRSCYTNVQLCLLHIHLICTYRRILTIVTNESANPWLKMFLCLKSKKCLKLEKFCR